jgi:hypothetical protein
MRRYSGQATSPDGVINVSATTIAETAVLPGVEDDATQIRFLAGTDVPSVLRELRELRIVESPRTRQVLQQREFRMLRDMAWRVVRGAFGRDEATERAARISKTQVRLGSLLDQLTVKIEQFLHLAAIAGSPPEYQQDLRESRIALARLMHEGAQDDGMTLETFKTLGHIVDLVELTRRDVERRGLENPVLAARFALARFPTEERQAVLEIFGTDPSQLDELTHAGQLDPETRRRAVLVAQLVYDLQFSHTPSGLLSWFRQPFPALGERTPTEALADPALEGTLRAYARSLRSQSAS